MDNNYRNMNDTNNTNGTNNRDYASNVNNANTTGNASDAGVNFTMSGNPYNPDESQRAAQTNNTIFLRPLFFFLFFAMLFFLFSMNVKPRVCVVLTRLL